MTHGTEASKFKVHIKTHLMCFTETELVVVISVLSEQQRSQDAPAAASHSRASDSSGESRRTPPSNADGVPQPPSSKPGWAEEGGSGWGSQAAPSNQQVVQSDGNNEELTCSVVQV